MHFKVHCDVEQHIDRFALLTVGLSSLLLTSIFQSQHFLLIFFVATHLDIYLLPVPSEQTVILILIFLLKLWVNFASVTDTRERIN